MIHASNITSVSWYHQVELHGRRQRLRTTLFFFLVKIVMKEKCFAFTSVSLHKLSNLWVFASKELHVITHFLGGGEDPAGNTCKAFRTVLGI